MNLKHFCQDNIKIYKYFFFFYFVWKEISRQEKVLEANVWLPADATKYKMEKLAEANYQKVVLEAEAAAESVKVRWGLSVIKLK